MKLKTYLTDNKIRASHFAKSLGVHPSTVHRISEGERRPRLDLAHKIIELTNHEVTLSDLCATAAGLAGQFSSAEA